MMPHTPHSSAQTWFRRSMSLTMAVGAVMVLLVAARPGYTAFFVTSTLAFIVAGFLWASGDPPARGRRAREAPSHAAIVGGLTPARSFRVTVAR